MFCTFLSLVLPSQVTVLYDWDCIILICVKIKRPVYMYHTSIKEVKVAFMYSFSVLILLILFDTMVTNTHFSQRRLNEFNLSPQRTVAGRLFSYVGL